MIRIDRSYMWRQEADASYRSPLSRRGQLNMMIHYVQMNSQRLATKRQRPGFFRVQNNIEIGYRKFDDVGNVALLMEDAYAPMHVRNIWVEKANHGNDQELRDYKNACVLKARKAADFLFDACASGRLLILSPWPYDGGKRHISRADCVALNEIAEICNCLNKQPCNDNR